MTARHFFQWIQVQYSFESYLKQIRIWHGEKILQGQEIKQTHFY